MRFPRATRPLSLRDVEELMVARGVVVTYETIRSWCAAFGPDYANSGVGADPAPATNGTLMDFPAWI